MKHLAVDPDSAALAADEAEEMIALGPSLIAEPVARVECGVDINPGHDGYFSRAVACEDGTKETDR